MNKSKIMARAYLLTESNRILHKDGGDNGHDGQVAQNEDNRHPPDLDRADFVHAEVQIVNRQQPPNANGVDPLQQDAGQPDDHIEVKDHPNVVDVVLNDGDPIVLGNNRLMFKDLDGKRKLADLPLPGLLQLPTGSCEAMLLRVSRNAGFGYVPINEYIRDRQTILDKGGNNGIFF